MQRLIIESIEGRILVGISMFVAIMILIGWVAINEEARMQSFVEQQTGRAIERGAELFASNCATCHGNDGLGIGGRAPALNNPHLFGYNPLGVFNDVVVNANRNLNSLIEEVDRLNTEAADTVSPPSDERLTEILTSIDELDSEISDYEAEIETASVDRDAVVAQLGNAIARGLYPRLSPDNNPPDPADLTTYLVANGTRLNQVGWTGSLDDYIVTTLIHGRPGSGNVWPNSEGMAAWSQLAGGPLRQDQIEDITAYILNWDKGDNWSIADYFAVQQFGKPLADGSLPSGPVVPKAGDNVEEIFATFESESIVGDVASGERIYNGVLGCSGCHAGGAAAPETAGTWTRVLNERLAEPQFAGYTGEQYLVESIVRPGDYVVDGYTNAMPQTFGDQLTHQQLADIVEYLKTQE